MKPILKSLPVSVAVAALAAAGCGTVTGGTPNSAPAARAGFTGYKWTVTAIDQAGKETAVPDRYGVGLQFTPNGGFGASDSVNYHSGTYRQAADGFATSSLYTTAMGYAGKDPVRAAGGERNLGLRQRCSRDCRTERRPAHGHSRRLHPYCPP